MFLLKTFNSTLEALIKRSALVDLRFQAFGMGHKKGGRRKYTIQPTLPKVRKMLKELEPEKPEEVVEQFEGILRTDSEYGPLAVESKEVVKKDRFSMTPNEYWITQGKGCERPFTGEFWYVKDVGNYECMRCGNQLFESQHKFSPPTGMASFWSHVPNSVTVVNDADQIQQDLTNVHILRYRDDKAKKQRCVCAKCKSHLGLVFMDGPAPTFLRYSINSASLKFVPLPWFPDPNIEKRKKTLLKMEKKLLEEHPEQDDVVPVEQKFRYDAQKYSSIIQNRIKEQHETEATKEAK